MNTISNMFKGGQGGCVADKTSACVLRGMVCGKHECFDLICKSVENW